LAARHRPAVEEAASDTSIPGLREGLDLLAGQQDFEQLLKDSLAFARYVMSLELNPESKDFPKLLSLKKEVMASVLSAGVRINDSALRRKEDDKVANLLKVVKDKNADSVRQPATEEVSMSDLFG
jgi:hypothetical protein